MGFWDFITSLFGGGPKMEVLLDASEVPVGGILSGKAKITGASKDYPMTSLKVQLVYVHVEAQEDSAIPKIDMRVLIDNSVANNEHLGANQTKEYNFTFGIPNGTEATGTGVSYLVKVVADIPGIKDPSAKADLKVIEAEEGGSGLTLDGLYSRWPALRGTAEQPLVDALRDMRWSHSEWDKEKDLIIAEPLLARLMREGSPEVQAAALETWSSIIGDRARKENLKVLSDFLARPDIDRDVMMEALEAAGRFAAVGGVALLKPFATHEDERVRSKVADSLHYTGGEGVEKRQLLEAMLSDSSDYVRRRAVDALSQYAEDRNLITRLAGLAAQEPHAAVLESIVRSIRSGFYYEHGDLIAPVYERLATHQVADVRRAIADSMGTAVGRCKGIETLALNLMKDPDPRVRSTVAYEVQNIDEEVRPQFKDALRGLADSDPDGEVRTSAIDALQSVLPKDEVVAYYRHLMATEPTEHVLRGVVHGAKFEEEPEYKAILKDLMSCPYPRVADEARSGYEYSSR